ncbi:MAG: polysaccharide biosynthesis/export family protein [Crocinitomicaceae bacterium]|nr:polysaccharide biosynthesis/export family protein [Flavobacteriales bacterium]NQZ35013.1 polysaccharide biosynthesis/export family protein [Crocinitomicaceae bacterium]
MKSQFWLLIAPVLTTIVLFSSCNTYKKIVYFQEDVANEGAINKVSYTPIYKPDDLLAIAITSESPEASAPYNLPAHLAILPSNSGYDNGIPAKSGYLVDSMGNINLSIIGQVHVGGLNRMEVTNIILEKLNEHLVNPGVQIQIQNFKITVLGDVRNPGTFKIPNERITILEAIGLAGDLNITGNRKNIIVIRNDAEAEKQYRVDLTTNKLFTSPVYYLDQNDVVYIEPNKAQRLSATTGLKIGSLIVSISSVILSLIVVAVK